MPDEEQVQDQVQDQVAPEAEQLLEAEPEEILADVVPDEETTGSSEASGSDSKWRNDQYALGQAMGLDPEQVRGFPSPEAFDRVANQFAERMQSEMAQSPSIQQEQQQAQQTLQSSQAREVFEFSDPSDYDPEMVEMNKFYTHKMGNMENTLNAVLMHTQRMQMEAAGREMDMILNNMDEGIYGRGRLNDLKEDDALNRITVADEVARLGQGYLARGEGVPPLDVLVDRASQSVHGKEMSQQALKRVSDKAGAVARQATALPQHRDDTPSAGYEAAVQAAANWQAEHGMSSQ